MYWFWSTSHFFDKNVTCLSVLTVQISEKIKTENVAAVSQALLQKLNGTLFSEEKYFFKR
jgi:hypothetical protein